MSRLPHARAHSPPDDRNKPALVNAYTTRFAAIRTAAIVVKLPNASTEIRDAIAAITMLTTAAPTSERSGETSLGLFTITSRGKDAGNQ
jgi:hypothetical protein